MENDTKFAQIAWNPLDHNFSIGARCVVEVDQEYRPISTVLDDAIIVSGVVYDMYGEYEGLVRVPLPAQVIPIGFDTSEEAGSYHATQLAMMHRGEEAKRETALNQLLWLTLTVALVAVLIGVILFLRSGGY